MVAKGNVNGRNWSSLSESYKARLSRAGISQRAYENGASLAGARGHGTTPERPGRATPERHSDYLARRRNLAREVLELKKDLFSSKSTFNPDNQKKFLAKQGIKELKRQKAQLQNAINSDGEIDTDDPAFQYH